MPISSVCAALGCSRYRWLVIGWDATTLRRLSICEDSGLQRVCFARGSMGRTIRRSAALRSLRLVEISLSSLHHSPSNAVCMKLKKAVLEI